MSRSGRRWLVPEVVQTSAMDCGPAALKGLLEGHGVPVSYGRLREACQTEVDGTSIDVLEAVAGQLGLQAEQVMVPVDHLLRPEAEALPALLVVRQPDGMTHFVVAWRRHGPLVQVMDPAVGRRWMTGGQLLDDVYPHTLAVPAEGWREWAASDDFRRPLAARLRALGVGCAAGAWIERAAADPGWRPLATLDATTRFVAVLVNAGGLKRGRPAGRLLHSLLERGAEPGAEAIIPDVHWSVRPVSAGPDGEEQVLIRGAVLVRIRGRSVADESATLSPELAAAVAEPPSRPGRVLLRWLGGAGALALLALAAGIALLAGGELVEAVLLRGVIDLGRDLTLVEQRLAAVAAFVVFTSVLLLVEWRIAGTLARLGRRLEVRLRVAFLEKLPRLNDRYFHSRPVSDMAERGHALHRVRMLPRLAGQFLRAAVTLLATAAAIAWADPPGAPWALLAAVVTLGLPIAFTPLLGGLDLRVRTHVGALGRFYLDALLGLTAIRAHGAEWAVRREHEGLLVEWAKASGRLLRWAVIVEGMQLTLGFGLAGWLLAAHAGRAAEAGGALLLAYWALSLPNLGEEVARLARQYPAHRSILLRLLEPLGAPEEETAPEESDEATGRSNQRRVRTADLGVSEPRSAQRTLLPQGAEAHDTLTATGSNPDRMGVAIALEAVTVRAAGHTILEDVDLRIEPGQHVAIVGASGAGKSSLVGLLLGWHRAAAGRVLVDGEPLTTRRLERLREETAWVDPAVQLWNRSLLDNLSYGAPGSVPSELGEALADAELDEILRRLPEGLQTRLGEGGGLLSGGEGQRVRFGRALLRADARLVILDEPFRGLDRARRRELLRRARRRWRGATLLCVTHDVGETRDFGRVLVIEAGRVAEDGAPAALAEVPGSRYRALLDAEHEVRTGLWADGGWRRLRLDEGRLIEDGTRGIATNGFAAHDQLAGLPAR